MRQDSETGFTLIEVVLAIAVGLIIIAGVSVGYTYAKRAAIADAQRKEVAAIMAFVEQAFTSQQAQIATGSTVCPDFTDDYNNDVAGQPGLCPPRIRTSQLGRLAAALTSLKVDPYSGAVRVSDDGTVPRDCYNDDDGACISALSTDTIGATDFPSGNMKDIAVWDTWNPTQNGGPQGAGVMYVFAPSFDQVLNVTLADGTSKRFIGWFVAASDIDGGIVAAEGNTATILSQNVVIPG